MANIKSFPNCSQLTFISFVERIVKWIAKFEKHGNICHILLDTLLRTYFIRQKTFYLSCSTYILYLWLKWHCERNKNIVIGVVKEVAILHVYTEQKYRRLAFYISLYRSSRKIHSKTPVLESLQACNLIKNETPTQVFFS